MTHTPAPWTVADKSYGWDHFAAIITSTGIVANCHIAALSRDYAQTAADARLIAAAPDLLEACETAALIMESLPHSVDQEDVKQLRTALAKARGETA